jgi:hypothetical protein
MMHFKDNINIVPRTDLQVDGMEAMWFEIFWLENGKFEFSRKQYIFLKHSKREFCAEFYYHF